MVHILGPRILYDFDVFNFGILYLYELGEILFVFHFVVEELERFFINNKYTV